MRGWIDYLEMAVEGVRAFATVYKLLPLVISVVLYLALRRNREEGKNTRPFLFYVIVVMVLILIPVTAAFLLMYQTRFYDYGWVWSFVPLTAVLAWGIVTIMWEELPPICVRGQNDRRATGKYRIAVVAVAVLWLCGNQGQMQRLSEETKEQQAVAEAVLQYLEDQDEAAQNVVWGPKIIMQYLRSHSGEIVL